MKKWVISFFVLVLLISLVSAESNETEIPPECIEAGITDLEECSVYIYNLLPGGDVPEGEELMENCRELGITTQEECDQLMAGEILSPECVEAGATTAEECSQYYYDKISSEQVSPQQESTTSTEETESAPTVCATEIKISFDKEVYYIGDTAKIVIEVLDSQGNHLPNYAFYNQMYDGIWHTPGLQRTDNEGYVKSTPTVERKQTTFGEIQFKVYTESYSNCNSVEDTTKIEVRGGEEPASAPVPCGIGTCIPEGEVEEVEAIPEERVFYKCNGCELEGKCYPMGYRKEGRYCSDNYEFIGQIEGACDNSFECKSNVCISGECIEEGLIKRIVKWFKKMFGGDEDEDEEPGLKMCSKLLIEKNIEDYEYNQSMYGPNKDAQVAVYSEDGEQIETIKCCVAIYDNDLGGGAAIICPFDNKKDLENTFSWVLNKGEIILGENYKGQKVYRGGEPEPEVIIWTNNAYLLASGGPEGGQLAEEIADAYLKKYPNDLEDITG